MVNKILGNGGDDIQPILEDEDVVRTAVSVPRSVKSRESATVQFTHAT
jgi:hypothetical protein